MFRYVYRSTHSNDPEEFEASFRYHGGLKVEERLFRPIDEDARSILVNTAFYLASSQLIGVPYHPSILRSKVLKRIFSRLYMREVLDAPRVVIELIEESRQAMAAEYFARMIDLNQIEVRIPLFLGKVLKESSSLADVMPIALQIRDSKNAAAFRRWCSEISSEIQRGNMGSMRELYREKDHIIDGINKWLGLKDDRGVDAQLGWGPATVSLPFALPTIFKKPVHLKRHLWFMHDSYLSIANQASIVKDIRRVIIGGQSDWFQDLVWRGEMNWSVLDEGLGAEI